MNYTELLEQGHKYQDFVADHLLAVKGIPLTFYTARENQYKKGETRCGAEVKLDNGCTKYGRLSIEVAEKQIDTSVYVPSGLHRSDNTWLYIQGNYDVIYFFSKKTLLRYERAAKPEYHCMPTIKKFYVPLEKAEQLAEFVIRPTT